METQGTLQKVLKHHSDTEWRNKIDDLFKFFCNHVLLGQWELARTAIPTLLKEFDRDERKITFIEILKAVIDYPFSQSLGSPSLKSAHHLSWLGLQELRQVEQDVISDKVKWFDQMTKDIDFRLTLNCLKDADKTVIQELYFFFKKHVLKVTSVSTEKYSTRNDFLSPSAVTLIKGTMVMSPSLGDSVVKALVCEEENMEKRHNEMLQALYIDCMNSLLDEIHNSENEESESLCDKVLQILSFYNPVPYWNYLQLRQLFTRLLNLSTEHTACHMTPEKIVSAITGRKSFYLLDEFCKIFQEVSLHTTYKLAEEPNNPLSDDQRVVLEIMTKLDRNVCWRDLFILCLKKRVHFLAEILDLSLSLITAGQFMELQDLLSYPELQPLKSAVLLMGWSHCVTSAHARTLLDTLWDDSSEIHNPVLAKMCRKLAYHLDLIQWCLDRAKPMLQNAEISPTRQATELLQGLETHSVLYMLHHSTSLASLDHSEVLQLLAHVSTDKKTKRKTVTFQDESESGLHANINIEQQKDLAIFRSYCAIKNVMDAVAFCAKYFDHKLMSPVHITRTVKAKCLDRHFLPEQAVSSSEGEDSSSPSLHQTQTLSRDSEEKESSEHFVRSYDTCVTKKLKETKDHLSHLQPLTYRLEILENIFSLIFVTHEDLCDVTGMIDVETDDDVDDSKLNSFGDNLNMSVISEEECAAETTSPEETRTFESTSAAQQLRSQADRSTSLDYDAPFIDPYQKQVPDLTPVYDDVKSSYFTQSSDHQRQAMDSAQLAQNIYLQSKKKRKRKRLVSDSCPNTLVGFLPNEYLVRDVLYLLKEALSDLNAAKFTITGKAPEKMPKDQSKSPKVKPPGADPKLESALQASLQSSVTPDTFAKRSTRLTQAVHEAWWRFQLMAHEAIPREPCHVLAERIFITDNDINFLPVCEGTAYSPDKGDSSRLPGTDSDLGSSSRPRSASSYTVLSNTNIVSQMMATPETLLVHSLVKGSLTQAAEVIKLFRLMEKTAESCEVLFANIYQTSARLIWELETEPKDGAKNPLKVGKRSMKALSKAAAVGVATASLSNIVEDLVSKPCVPPVPRPKTAIARENYWHYFNLDSTSALLLDLLCTACRTWDTCANMLDIIKTRTKLLERHPGHSPANSSPSASSLQDQSSNPSSGSSSSSVATVSQPVSLQGGKQSLHGIKGCNQLAWCLYDLLQLGDSRPHGHLGTSQHQVSLQHHMHSAYSSLSVQNLRSLDVALAEIRRAVDHVQQILLGSAPGHLDISANDPVPSASVSSRGSSSSLSGSTSGSAVLGSKVSVKQPTDENPLHVGVKHLMYIMEKYAPGGGLTQLLHVKSSSPFKNYLLSLYKHVKEMTHLVAECQGQNKEMSSNYFKVLEDGPVNILGRLLFVKKMPPARLEAVAEKLSLNLTHTIVYSCCPKIPSKHPPPITLPANDTSVMMRSTRVYNLQTEGHLKAADQSSPDQPKSNPEEIVRDILTELVTIMEGISSQQSARGVFDLTCAKHLVQMKVYTPLMARVNNLRDVDLSLLATNEQRLCFLVNLTNLMMLHCHLTCVFNRIESQRQLEELGKFDEEEVELYPLTAADNLAYLSSFSYCVGQLGIVSVFDLHTILEQDQRQSSCQWGNLLAFRKLVLSPDDPWKKFSPLPEPRTLFLINTGCTSSPPLKVLSPDTVTQQLEQAVRDYLVHSVLVSVEKEKVSLPEFLVWNEPRLTCGETKTSTGRHAALLSWVSDFICAEKKQQLQQLLQLDGVHDVKGRSELPFQLDIARYDNTFSVTFDVSHVKVGQLDDLETPVVRNKPKAAAYPFSNSYDRSGQGWSLELPIYNLSPVTLEYVKQDSLLVATMVSLTCADNLDNIEQQFTDDHFNQPESSVSGQYDMPPVRPQRSSSDISLVDIRSYRYHRLTDDYPVLQRHLLHYILPLAGADNSELLESREPILKFVTNDISDQVKLCMFSLPNSTQFQCVVQDMANRLLEEHKWTEILNILGSLSGTVLQDRLHLQVLQDFVLSCWALTVLQKPAVGVKIGHGLRKFYNPALQARTILTICHVLPLDLSLDLLDHCLTVLDDRCGLRQAVHNKYQQFLLYKKIKDCVDRLSLQLSDCPVPLLGPSEQHLHRVLEKLSEWKNITAVCRDNPEDVLMVLERSGDFESARTWAELHDLNTSIVKQIQEHHLYHLLTLDNPDTVGAFQLLDKILTISPQECLLVCQNLVASLVHPREIKFILSFMLRNLSRLLPPDDVEELRLKRIGSKALMYIPAVIQPEYNHLISCPRLILEQLLMNMKAELAGQIFEHIKMDFGEIKEPKLRVSPEEFNNLLASYANKAIQVNVVQVIADPSRSESASSNNSASQDDVVSSRRLSSDHRRSDLSVSPTGSTGPRQEAGQRTVNKLSGDTGTDSKPFVMPPQPPTQDQWTPDSSTSVCMVCKVERFSMFNRRHHCRRCGRVVGATCSTKQSLVFGSMARTCDDCWHQMNSKEDHEIYSQRMKERLSGVSVSPAPPGTSASPHLAGLLSPERLKRSLMSAIHHVDHSWKLRPDTSYSQQVRSEFYYEQAPSVSLCISLLKQHSSKLEAGKLILEICDNLSTYLVPISPGVPNPEIDYSLIISVMKQLLFHSKLDFLHTSHMELLGQCDLYLARVDLLQVMVEANYQDLPTIRELTKQDTIRRLRDKLITDERLSLAMEVSTKCGIDPTGVWAAMGFSSLHLGDFQGARDKFGHCFKVLPDKNQISVSQNRLLGEVLDFLDSLPSNGLTELQRLLSTPSSICNIQTLLVPSKGEEDRVESVPYKECLYYLRTYGSYMDHITFLRQHGYWMKAVKFAVDHHCSADVFVTGLMVPAMTSGELGHLLEQMLMLDPTLDKWTSYLTDTCKYLLKQKYFSTLYQIQLFMKDYIRASMTCITHFYQRGAQSYLDLSGRMQFLFTAQQHLQAYLDPGQWGSVLHPLAPHTPVTGTSVRQVPSWDKVSPESAARMTLTPEQVNKHIRTISLQIEVTKFLEQCLTQSMGGAALVQPAAKLTQGTQIPTLFGQTSSRTELVSMIILSGANFKAGFELALRIIRECRLNSTVIFSFCSRELAKQNRFGEIKALTQSLLHDGLVDDEGIDEIIGASLLVVADTNSQARDESDQLIQLLRSDSNKINAYILCGKLRSAYLLAVKRDLVVDVQRIAGAAQRLGQMAVKNICKKWLEEHQK